MKTQQTKICLFGGSFDPIHLGHTYIAGQMIQQLDLDQVIFIPCQQSPHKTKPTQFSALQRFEMCQKATENLLWAKVSDFEITSSDPSYSWKTAEYFAARYPNASLYWLMGSDQWSAIDQWSRPEYFAQLAQIIVYNRNNLPQKHPQLPHIPLPCLQHPASSTHIRQQTHSGSFAKWLHPEVAKYIKKL